MFLLILSLLPFHDLFQLFFSYFGFLIQCSDHIEHFMEFLYLSSRPQKSQTLPSII